MIRLAERTWPEAARLARDPRSVVLLPLGAIEQHGPHLPLLVDWLGAEELARRVAPHLRRGGFRPIVLPGLPYGASPLARGFAGTISLSARTLVAVAAEILDALAAHGFRRFVLANYQADPAHLAAMARIKRRSELRPRRGPGPAGGPPRGGGSSRASCSGGPARSGRDGWAAQPPPLRGERRAHPRRHRRRFGQARVQLDEDRALLLQERRQPALQLAELADRGRGTVAGPLRHLHEVHTAAAGNLLRAGGVVHAVLEEEVDEVARRRARHRRQRAELHQQRAVAVEHEHAAVGTGEGQPQPQRRGAAHESHAADREVVRRDRPPGGRRRHRRHAQRVAARRRDGAQRVFGLDGHQAVSRPTSTAAGPWRFWASR